jgi:hypothetical protein
MRIDCYLSPDCASEEALRENIAGALALENIDAEINFHKIDDSKANCRGLRPASRDSRDQIR